MLALLCPAAFAQTVELTAGTGSLYSDGSQSGGMSAEMWLPNSTLIGDIGYADGRVWLGLSDEYKFRGWDVVAGNRMMSLSTTTTGVGVALFGVSASRKTSTTELDLFTGSVGVGFNAPWTSGTRLQHVGSGELYKKKIFGFEFAELGAIDGGQHTLVESIDYKFQNSFEATEAAGLLMNQKFVTGQMMWRPWKKANVYAAHNFYITPIVVSANSVGASVNPGHFSLSAGWNNSSSTIHTTGENVGAGFHLGPEQLSVSYYRTISNTTRSLLFVNSTERVRRYSLNESFSDSNGHQNFSFGGGFSKDRLAFNLSHGVQWMLDGLGYQQTTQISVSIRIRDTQFVGTTSTSPFGTTYYDAYAQTYIQSNLGLGQGGPIVTTHSSGGKYTVSGSCKTPDGKPVDGCSVTIEKTLVYANSEGKFSARTKHQKSSITVDVESFVAPGRWRVKDAPATAEAGQTITVVVERF